MNLPNFLTAIRILLIPFFIGLLLYERHLWAAVVFCTAGVTDILDGMAARHSRQTSRLGAFLDPLADKLLSVSSFVTLSVSGPIPVWFVVIVISRDIMISLGSLILFLVEGSLEIIPSSLGKATTFLQFAMILGTILYQMSGRGHAFWRAALLATAAVTFLSGLQYLYRGLSARGPAGRD